MELSRATRMTQICLTHQVLAMECLASAAANLEAIAELVLLNILGDHQGYHHNCHHGYGHNNIDHVVLWWTTR